MVICYNTGIIVASGFIIVSYLFWRFDSTANWFVPDHLSWLRLFMSGCICTPLIILATSRFCLGLTYFVVTEAVVLVVFLFLLRRLFTPCSLAGSVSIRCWVSQLSLIHYSFPYHLVGSLMLTPFPLWILFSLSLSPRPPRPPLHGILFLKIIHICLLFLLSQLSLPAVYVHTFLIMAGFLGKFVI